MRQPSGPSSLSGEMVPPEEVADLVALVSTGLYRHLSGATLDVNGAAYIR